MLPGAKARSGPASSDGASREVCPSPDPRKTSGFVLGLATLRACMEQGKKEFAWREPPYEYDTKTQPIKLILGTPAAPKLLEAEDFDLRNPVWHKGCEKYIKDVAPSLLYERKMQVLVP